MKAVCVCIAAALVCVCAKPGPYLPSGEASTWAYVGLGGRDTLVVRISGWDVSGADTALVQRMSLAWHGNLGDSSVWFLRANEKGVGLQAAQTPGASRDVGPLAPVLVLPLKADSTWDVTGGLPGFTPGVNTVATCLGFESIKTPAGSFARCARIRYSVGEHSKYNVWFAPGVGVVRIEYDPSMYGESPPPADDRALFTLTSYDVTGERAAPPTGAELEKLRLAAQERSVRDAMHALQTTLEAYAVEHFGRYPGVDMPWNGSDTTGIAFWLPGGDAFSKTFGRMPMNPMSGRPYMQGTDLFYELRGGDPSGPSVLWADDPACIYVDFPAPAGQPGTIRVLAFAGPSGGVQRYYIVGYGSDPATPLNDTDDRGSRVFYVLHN